MTRQEFIEHLASKLDNCPVLKSLAIGQACLESSFGKKSFYNNIYGIKCWDPKAYAGCRLGRTSEVINGEYEHGLHLAFQTYDTIDDSIADYCRLMNIKRYKRVREATNYIDATQAIKDCGYATSLTYIKSLRRLVGQYDLTKYDGDIMTCEDLDYDGYQKYKDKLTRNIVFGECWSSVVRLGIVFRRKIKPIFEVMDNIFITADETQKIRNRLNEVYGYNPKIGYRNRLNEIIIIINSFWRTAVYQRYLYIKKLTICDGYKRKSQHQLGKAVDLKTPRGMTPYEFFIFIKDKCNTKFTWFKVYSWGVHCDWR